MGSYDVLGQLKICCTHTFIASFFVPRKSSLPRYYPSVLWTAATYPHTLWRRVFLSFVVPTPPT